MCPYGIIINDDKNYLIFLERVQSIEDTKEVVYSSVDGGCPGLSTYLIENNQIDLNGQKLSLEDFASKYSLIPPKKAINNGEHLKYSDTDQTKNSTVNIKQEQNLKYLRLYYIYIIFCVFESNEKKKIICRQRGKSVMVFLAGFAGEKPEIVVQ